MLKLLKKRNVSGLCRLERGIWKEICLVFFDGSDWSKLLNGAL